MTARTSSTRRMRPRPGRSARGAALAAALLLATPPARAGGDGEPVRPAAEASHPGPMEFAIDDVLVIIAHPLAVIAAVLMQELGPTEAARKPPEGPTPAASSEVGGSSAVSRPGRP
jgi:hypothetical protein